VGAPIGDIAEIYGKARVAGTLFAEDINQLTGRGIPIIGEFARQLGVSESEVKKLGSQGKITFPMLEQAFKDMTGEGGKFGGMMAAQSGTVAGMLSTLSDSFGSVLLELGRPINDAIRPMLKEGIGMMDSLKQAAGIAGETIAGAFKAIIAAWQELSFDDMGALASASLSIAFKEVVNFLYAGLMGVSSAFGQALVQQGRNILELLGVLTTADFWKGLGNVLLGLFQGVVGFFGQAIANILEEFKKVPGLGKILGDADGAMREVSGEYLDSSKENLAQGGVQLGPILDRGMQRMGEQFEAVGKAFSEGFSRAGKVMDSTGERESLEAARLRIAERMAKSEEASKKATEEVKGAKENAAPPAAAGAGFAVNGRISGAINSIMGRSTNELLASSMQQVAEGVAEVQKNTAAIAENTKPKTDTKAKPVPSKTPTGVFT
jgi:tape measure domain-containing protein